MAQSFFNNLLSTIPATVGRWIEWADGSIILTYNGTPVEGMTYIIDFIVMG